MVDDPDRTALGRARDARERVIAALSDAFAHDALDVDEFERRVTIAHTSESAADIEALLGGLGARDTALAPPPAATTALAPPGSVRDRQTVCAIMGGVDRRGAWTMPRHLKLVAVMGGARLDLREARFPAGVVDIEIFSLMGGTEIIVPPGLSVETQGSAIMGGFQEVHRAPAHPDPDAPLLRVHGLVVMGGVEIKTQLPGESARDARRRERHALKAGRRAARALERARDERR